MNKGRGTVSLTPGTAGTIPSNTKNEKSHGF